MCAPDQAVCVFFMSCNSFVFITHVLIVCWCLSHAVVYSTVDTHLEHQISSMGHRPGHMHSASQPQEPNLNDVVDYLTNSDSTLIANAASYLQHLAYNDDQMKAKIRQYGAIPALISQLRHPDFRVQLAVLGALRNMSYGRTNNESKVEIADDPGLGELTILLKITSHAEVNRSLSCSPCILLTPSLSLSFTCPSSLSFRFESWLLRYCGISLVVK